LDSSIDPILGYFQTIESILKLNNIISIHMGQFYFQTIESILKQDKNKHNDTQKGRNFQTIESILKQFFISSFF